jgi:hypothetical protein
MRVPNQNFVSMGTNREQVFFAVGETADYEIAEMRERKPPF